MDPEQETLAEKRKYLKPRKRADIGKDSSVETPDLKSQLLKEIKATEGPFVFGMRSTEKEKESIWAMRSPVSNSPPVTPPQRLLPSTPDDSPPPVALKRRPPLQPSERINPFSGAAILPTQESSPYSGNNRPPRDMSPFPQGKRSALSSIPNVCLSKIPRVTTTKQLLEAMHFKAAPISAVTTTSENLSFPGTLPTFGDNETSNLTVPMSPFSQAPPPPEFTPVLETGSELLVKPISFPRARSKAPDLPWDPIQSWRTPEPVLLSPVPDKTSINPFFQGFGSTTNAPFGQTSQLFGNTSGSFGSSSSGFGSTTPSMFGTPQQSAAPLFGSSSTSSFGQANQTGFGSTLFGNTSQQPSSSGLFGNSGNSSFGQQNKPAGFGFSSGAPGGLFGQTATQTAPNSSMFQPSSTLFGNTSTFGGAAGQNGTVIKFSPVTGTDSMQKSGVAHTISTKHHCITCMKEYENKSLEELRWEDYQANRKGPQQQAGFGTPQPFGVTASAAPTLFGQTDNKTVFGQTAPGFGQSTGFGLAPQSTTSNIFGKPAVSGFGATTTASNAFGFGTNTSTTGGLFGTNTPKFAPSNQTLFGATQPQQNTFGNANLFGQPAAQTTGGLFGKPAQPTGFNSFSFGTGQQNLFQNPKPNTAFNIFGQTPTTNTAFGQQQPQQQSNFGFMSFGKPQQNTFGQPNVFGLGGGNLFGNTAAKPSGLFGNNTSSNFFGNNNFQPNTGFMMPNQMQQMMPNQNVVPTTENIDLGSILQVTDPYGYNPHLEGLSPVKSPEAVPYTTNPKELQKLLEAPQRIAVISPITKRMKVLPRTTHKVNVFDDIADKNTTDMNFGLKTAAKRLVLKKDKQSPPSGTRENLNDVSLSATDVENGDQRNDFLPDARKAKSGNRPNFVAMSMSFSMYDTENGFNESENITSVEGDESKQLNNTNPAVGIANDDVLTNGLPKGNSTIPTIYESSETESVYTCGVILTRPEYYTVPTLDKLVEYTQPDGTCLVKGFTIGRVGFGSVSFPDLIDVTDLNIDELVHFRYRELTIYPDDTKKPPLGQGLNRRAQVTLDRVYPKDRIERTLITDIDTLVSINFIDTLRDLCEKHGTKFLDYRADTGSWVFSVEHFSKYGFSDSEEETDNEKVVKEKQDKKKIKDKKAEKKKLLEEKIIQDEINEALLIAEDKENEKFLYDEDLEMRSGLGGFSEIGDDIEDIDIDLAHGMHTNDLHCVTSRRSLYNNGGTLLHVMKAALFDEEYMPDPDFPTLEIFEDESQLFEELLSSESQGEITTPDQPTFQKPDVFALCNKFCDIPKNKYLFHSRSYMDIGIFKHKSFKVGWGRGSTLATTLPPSNSDHFESVGFLEHCPTVITIIDVSELTPRDIYTDSLTEHLRIVLEESKITLIDGVPLLKVKDGESMLLRHQLLATESAEISSNKEARYYKEIWNLCLAFWGPITRPTRRRDLFSEWLEDVSRDKIHQELNSRPKNDPSNVLQNIFIHLTGHQIMEAAEIAINNKMPKLSLLLSQLNLNASSKLYMNEQLEQWKFATSLEHIDFIMKKIYMTISGVSVSGGSSQPQLGAVNICENLDWRRALAMFLWYVTPEPSPLHEAVLLYQEAFTTYGYVSRPTTKHLNDNEENIYDIQYYLMLLFCKVTQTLEDILNPHTHTDYPADYRLSWLLLQTLTSLGSGVMNKNAKDYTTTSFAQQLENMGYYSWAVFVLLYIEDNSVKRNLIMGVLDRTLKFDLSDIDIEDEIVQDFCVPSEWLHIVKANKTNMLMNHWETYRNFTYGNKWYECHEMAINHILPDLVINEDYEPIVEILETLDDGKEQILNWNYQAGLLVNFITLLEVFQNENGITNDLTLRIHNNLVDFCTKLKAFPKNNSKQIACISEVSKHCSIFIRIILKYMDPSYKGIFDTFSQIKLLIMPSDYKMDEVSKDVRTYLTDG